MKATPPLDGTKRLAILQGNCLEVLRTLPDESVHCVVTSPPYWSLRDYGIGPVWWPAVEYAPMPGVPCQIQVPEQDCVLGLEAKLEDFIGHIVAVFREVRRVLRKDGTCWVNMGDSYSLGGRGGNPDGSEASTLEGGQESQNASRVRCSDKSTIRGNGHQGGGPKTKVQTVPAMRTMQFESGLPPKNTVGQPWRVAFALQADGWILRQDVIWSKANPMPESVTDRPTRAHEYVFLLVKGRKYHYDAAAIEEPVSGGANPRRSFNGIGFGHGSDNKKRWVPGAEPSGDRAPGVNPKACGKNSRVNVDRDPAHQTESKIRAKQNRSFSEAVTGLVETRNKRSVWTVATQPYKEAHFATFPPNLIRPCILAGCPPNGVVLDPFGGSGTTAEVALKAGRRAVLIEVNGDYIELANRRTSVQLGLAL